MTYRERRLRRAERRDDWADGRRRKARAAESTADAIASGIPMGQPILVGHHSEKRHRRDADRITKSMDRMVEHDRMADHHEQAAKTIRAQVDRSIYDDDTDRDDRLRDKIADLERQRGRMREINAWFGKHGGVPRRNLWKAGPESQKMAVRAIMRCKDELQLTATEMRDIELAAQMNGVLGYPSYALSNLGANIRRAQKRLDASPGPCGVCGNDHRGDC